MEIVGLTGGIGSGKSVAAENFKELGIKIINADEIGKDILATEQTVISKIVEYFGDDITTENNLDRNKIREIIFSDENQKQWLENLLHPLIKEKILQIVEDYKATAKAKYCILEAAILIESDFHKLVDKIIVIDCEEQQQISRVVKRNILSKPEIKKIMQAQLKRKQRLKHADVIIFNDGSLSNLKSQVLKIYNKLLK